MENRDKGFKILAVAALLIATVGLGIAYAGYTSTLTITGTASAESAWEIIWENLDSGTATGYASVDSAELEIDDTNQAISGTIGSLKAPGDTITYTWDASNTGSINAKLTGISLGTLSCAPATGSDATQDEATALCSDLTVSFKYDNVTLEIPNGKSSVMDALASTNLPLNSSSSKDVEMVITYKSTATTTISDSIEVTLGSTSFTYSQAEASK